MIKNIKIILCSVLITHALFAMDIAQLPSDLNWPILEQLLQQTELQNVHQVIKKIALISKKNNAFINRSDTIENIINLLNVRTENKVRAAELIKTKAFKEWLDKYLKKEEGKKDFAQAREDEQKFIKLVSSVAKPNLEEIKNYLNKGINVNAVMPSGESALFMASGNGLSDAVALLLSVPGINVNAAHNGLTPLDLASTLGLVSVIPVLKAAGAKSAKELKK